MHLQLVVIVCIPTTFALTCYYCAGYDDCATSVGDYFFKLPNTINCLPGQRYCMSIEGNDGKILTKGCAFKKTTRMCFSTGCPTKPNSMTCQADLCNAEFSSTTSIIFLILSIALLAMLALYYIILRVRASNRRSYLNSAHSDHHEKAPIAFKCSCS
ncbi:hypothetical protein M3Y97_00669700 [Aphelenchoides bicaudatus]|nr:hypothetical protein M3Y97_00669700 [Aphelenchoides bicaudatus]